MINKKSKIFVAGHRGMIGSAILRKLNELNYLRGNYNKAKKLLKWKPKISFKNLVKEMVQEDIKILKNGS